MKSLLAFYTRIKFTLNDRALIDTSLGQNTSSEIQLNDTVLQTEEKELIRLAVRVSLSQTPESQRLIVKQKLQILLNFSSNYEDFKNRLNEQIEYFQQNDCDNLIKLGLFAFGAAATTQAISSVSSCNML